MSQLEQRLAELRFIDGIEKVEHVRFSTGDQFWVRFIRPLDMQKLRHVVKNRGYRMVKFGGLPSKLPWTRRGSVEWCNSRHCERNQWVGRFTSSLGFEPDGIGKIAVDLHGPFQIFMAMNEDGVQLLYDYLGVKYVPPPPPPKPVVAAAKPPIPVVKPAAVPVPRPPNQAPATTPPVVAKADPTTPQTTPPEEKATTT